MSDSERQIKSKSQSLKKKKITKNCGTFLHIVKQKFPFNV